MPTPAELDAMTEAMTPRQFKAHFKAIETHLLNDREDLALEAFWEAADRMNDKMVCAMMRLIGLSLNEAGV
jgi:hypothetical protein